MSEAPDGPDPEIEAEPEIEVVPEPERSYFWTDNADEQRRCFIFESMANADIELNVFVRNMQACFDWLKSGKVPTASKQALKVVKSSE